MPRSRTGSTYLKHGVRQLAIRTDRPGAPRPKWVKPCPPAPDGTAMDELDAKLAALRMQKAYDAGTWDPWAPVTAPSGELLSAYGDRWCDDRAGRRGLRSVRDDRGRLRNYVYPRLGTRPVAAITTDELEGLRDHLDRLAGEGSITPKTATNVWWVVTRLFKDAARSKVRALRARADNPCAAIEPPDSGDARSKSYLYPSEALAVAGCGAVGLEFRMLVAVAIWTYARQGELAALECGDIDLAHDDIHIHRSLDFKSGEVHEAKTAAGNRHVPIEPTLKPLLSLLVATCEGRGRLFPEFPSPRDAAKFVRAALATAGVTRAALFANDATRKHITFHDLRATGITWCAVRGDEAVRIMRRAGHADFDTTLGYIREAENRRAGFGTVFPALAGVLPGGAATPPATEGTAETANRAKAEGLSPVPAAGVEPPEAATAGDSPRPYAHLPPEARHDATPGDTERPGLATAVAGLATLAARQLASEAALWNWHDRVLAAEAVGITGVN